ncbi:MAG: PAS domain-containing protein [Deltaproteobacteria bacterium]|nr:PAS domain-containing protein [Deltaproteobacteria bacterium]
MTDATANDSGEPVGRLRSLLNASPAVVYCARPHVGFERTFVSDNVERLIGFTAKEVLDRPGFWAERIHADDRRGCLAALAEAIERGHAVCEYRIRQRNGRYVWIRDEALLSRDGHGLPLEMTGSLIDISRENTPSCICEPAKPGTGRLSRIRPIWCVVSFRTGR